jgi:hypothetical protein
MSVLLYIAKLTQSAPALFLWFDRIVAFCETTYPVPVSRA